MRYFIFFCILSVTGYGQQPAFPTVVNICEDRPEVKLARFTSQPDSAISQFKKVEFGISLPSDLSERIRGFLAQSVRVEHPINPFNPSQIDIHATFFYEGEEEGKVNGFYYEEFKKDLPSNRWIKDTTSFPFRIRYAPKREGQYSVQIRLSAWSYDTLFVHWDFDVKASNSEGYLEVGKYGKHLRFSKSKQSFFGVGQVLPWPEWDDWSHLDKAIGPKPVEKMYQALDALDQAGGNFTRFVAATWFLQLEYEALGNYAPRLNHAWEFDRMIEYCEDRDIYFLFCALLHTPLESRSDEKANELPGVRWEEYCYNDATKKKSQFAREAPIGITKAVEFYSDEKAIEMSKRYFRYLVARYGYTTSLAGWQLMSEVDETAEYRDKVLDSVVVDHSHNRMSVRNWTNVMSTYMRQELGDPHLISISLINGKGYSKTLWDPELFNLPNIDFFGFHDYMFETKPSEGKTRNRNLLIRYTSVNELNCGYQNGSVSYPNYQNKPFIFDEFGHLLTIPRKIPEDQSDDPTVAFNNCADFMFKQDLWFTFASGCAVAGLDWWNHDKLPRHQMWQTYFPGIRYFSSLIDFEQYDFSKVRYHNGYPNMAQRWPATDDLVIRSSKEPYRKDDKLEAYTQVSEDGTVAFGWMCNRTVNWFNLKDSMSCLKSLYDGTDPFVIPYIYKPKDADLLGKPLDLKKGSAYFFIRDLPKRAVYTLDFFHTTEARIVCQNKVKSDRKGNLKIKCPEMTVQENPDLAFILRRKIP